MSRNILILISSITIVLLVLVYLYRPTPFPTNYPPPNFTAIAFGDSLVAGVGSTAGNDFVSKLATVLGREIVNKGVSGNTTADGVDRLATIVQLQPGTVFLLLGGNDAIRRVPRAETDANLRVIISTLHDHGVFVVLLGVRGGLLTDNLETMFNKIAKETNVLYIPDVLDGLFGNPELMADAIHPNNAGYELIAGRVYKALNELP